MPAPVCRCSICGKEVNKKRTYHIGDGKRACKEHDGVEKRKNALQISETVRQKEAVRNSRPKAPSRLSRTLSKNPGKPCCWLCGLDGIDARKFYLNKLIRMEKHELMHGEPGNIFDPKHPVNAAEEEAPIFIIPLSKVEHLVKNIPDEGIRSMVPFVGVVAMCPLCMKKHEVPFPGGEVTIENLHKMGVAYELVVKDKIRKMAIHEMTERN
jgi:hypothetical protein